MYADLLDEEVDIEGQKYKNPYAKDVKIDMSNLFEECENHAEKLAYYGRLAALAEVEHENAKEDLEYVEAVLDAEKRGQAQNNPTVKWTETMYKNSVRGDKRYLDTLVKVMNLKKKSAVLKANYFSFMHRKDMINNLCGLTRNTQVMRVTDADRF